MVLLHPAYAFPDSQHPSRVSEREIKRKTKSKANKIKNIMQHRGERSG
jgi:hypothetical protein